MRKFSHYTEEDFQRYFDNCFNGDENSFKEHLGTCEYCRESFEAYSLVWSFVKNDLKIEPMRTDLAVTVANKVFSIKESKYIFEKILYGILISLLFISLLWCFKYFVSNSLPFTYILLIIPFCLYFWVNYKEIKIVEQKYLT